MKGKRGKSLPVKPTPLVDAARRALRAMAKCIRRTRRGLVGVARRAGIRNFVYLRLSRCDECKRVRVHVHIGDRRLDCRHVAAHALAPRRARTMMRMLFQCPPARPLAHSPTLPLTPHFILPKP